ncbi:hypothetical protein B0O99DRAFT_543302 [Bisporella sp. PMI_857]|nr:hypothetical protein B0O99DRAFT_543302 [Bisporella sp. PMI_857]
MLSDDDTVLENNFPFMTSKSLSMEDLLASLPPVHHCTYLKDTYFSVFSPLFHILHDPTFHTEYIGFLNDPNSVSLSWLAILFVILSLAIDALEQDDYILRDLVRGSNASKNVTALGRRYREAAMNCLAKNGVFWGRHDVHSLQALILLAYGMSHSQEPTWALLGMTYNVAIALGCHIDPESLPLNKIQCEERRRCFAGLMMLYTIQSTALGNLDALLQHKYDVRLPANVNDVDITESLIKLPAAGPTQMTYLLFKFQLYNLATKICQEIFASAPSRASIQDLDQQICATQELWDAQYLADSSTGAIPAYHAAHLHILHGYAHQLFLLLHRPLFAQSVLGLDIPNESQIRCIASAEALLDIHRVLCETPEYRKYLWYTNGLGSFHAFHAAVVLSVAFQMPIYRPQWRKFRSELEETVVRFDKLAERSPICAKGSRVLRFLLNLDYSKSKQRDSLVAVQPPTLISSNNSYSEAASWISATEDNLKHLSERLNPQQWLSPSAVFWNEWEKFIG